MKAEVLHIHRFVEVKPLRVALRRFDFERGKPVADVITATDQLKRRKCACGQVETYDLQRTLA